MAELTREKILSLASEIAARMGQRSLTRSEFMRESGISTHQIYNLFPEGGWTEICRESGLEIGGSGYPIEEEELLEEYHSVVSKLNKIPTWNVFQTRSRLSADTVRRRFGGTQGTLKKYRKWLELNHPDSPFIDLIGTKSKHEIPAPPSTPNSETSISNQWPKTDQVEFGAPISFRGLTHAPINEQGVVYLFGMVSYELGFIVEAVQSTFPDCEAKRCIDTKKNRWQRVRIEFEYLSSNFRQHGHDLSGCDLIVCWQHDWQECPIEVLELRTLIDQLDG